MAYPSTPDNFAAHSDGQTIYSAHVNELQTAIEAMQAEIGTDPSGAAASVAARLDGVDSAIAGLSSTYVRTVNGTGPDGSGNVAVSGSGSGGGAQINVLDYLSPGRTPGTTDDTTGILAAIAACTAGKTLLFPPGPYKGADVLAFTGRDNITVQAHGATIDLTDDGTATGRIVQVSNCAGFRWLGGRLTQTAAARTGVYGLLTLDLVDEALVDGLTTVGGSSAGIFTARATSLRIVAPRVADSKADGIHISRGSIDVALTGALVKNTGDDAIAVVSITNDGATTYSQCSRVSIVGAVVSGLVGTVGSGVALVGPRDVTLSGVVVATAPAAGIKVASSAGFHSASDITVSGSHVRGALHGFQLGDCTDVTLAGCSATGNVESGVALLGPSRAHISGGKYRGNGGFGLYENAGTGNHASGADLRGNTLGTHQVASLTLDGCVTA